MKYGVACLFLIVFAIGYAHAQEKECQPGETKQEDCNTCTCTSTGVFACTRKLCIHKREAPPNSYKFLDKSEPLDCQPGEIIDDGDCNYCRCLDDGSFVCTKRMCLDKKLSKREAISARFNSQLTREKRDINLVDCQPGETLKLDCNTCFCDGDGSFACTKMMCLNKREAISARFNQQLPREKRDAQCIPGTSYQKDCNYCNCSPDGVEFCTLQYSKQCVPGTTYLIYGKSCSCSKDGVVNCPSPF